MRKIVYVCDRCGAEIDGDAAGIEIKQKDSKGYEDEADLIDVSALFADKAERSAVEGALSWDICGECLAAVLRTLIKTGTPRVKCNLPDVQITHRKKGRPRKTVERKLEFKQRKPRKWSDEDLQKAVELAEQGHSFSYIADALGVTRRTVEEHLGTENGGIPEE